MIQDFDVPSRRHSLISRHDIDQADLPGIVEAIDVMLNALKVEPLLSEEGLDRQLRIIDENLEALAAISADRRRYPEIAQVKIVKPVFITGLGRSGTTFLHSLLSRDPANRCPLGWESRFPSPPPEATSYDTDPRIARAEQHFRSKPAGPWQDTTNLEMQKKHMSGPLLTEEDNALMRISMRTLPGGAGPRILPYFHWLLEQDSKLQYGMHKRFLQQLQWRNPRERWLLKAPTHMHNLPALFATYPDAMIVWCHRDPAEAISSMTSVVSTLRSSFMTVVDPPAIALEFINYWSPGVIRGMAFRRAHQEIPIFDIGHREIITDPLESVRRIYAHFGFPLDDIAKRRLTQFVEENPREKLGAHTHGIKRYGLTSSRIHEIFQDYITTFAQYI